MWSTDFFDNTVLSVSTTKAIRHAQNYIKIFLQTMVLSNSSKNLKMWTNPSPTALVNIHIFNYTNLKAYDDRLERKLKVQDVGPYVYE